MGSRQSISEPLVVGPVDLVDQQDRPVTPADRLEQRALQQELGPEELVDGPLVGGLGRAGRATAD